MSRRARPGHDGCRNITRVLCWIWSGLHGMDEVDDGGAALMDDLGADTCLYLMVDSMDRLQLNVTPLGVSVLQDVVEVCVCV